MTIICLAAPGGWEATAGGRQLGGGGGGPDHAGQASYPSMSEEIKW